MKKILLVFLCIFALTLGGCKNRQNTPLGYGLEMIDTIEAMMSSEDYYRTYLNGNTKYIEKVEELRDYDLSKPKRVFSVTFDDLEVIETLVGSEAAENNAEFYKGKLASSIVSRINSSDGTDSIVVASCFYTTKTFDCRSVEEDMVYFYIYEDMVVSVAFTDGEGDSCTAAAYLVLNSSLDTSSVEDFEDSIEEILIGCDFDVKKVY